MQNVNYEKSAVPRTMYLKSNVNSKTERLDLFESDLYVQKTEMILETLIKEYTKLQGHKYPAQPQHFALDIKNRIPREPELHLTLKVFGLQRLFSIDSRYIQKTVKKLTEDYARIDLYGGRKDVVKALDLSGSHSIIPTEDGMPLYVENRTPIVLSLHASLVKVKRHEVKLKIKPVINYKKTTRVGFYCPFC